MRLAKSVPQQALRRLPDADLRSMRLIRLISVGHGEALPLYLARLPGLA